MADATTNDVERVVPNKNQCIGKMALPQGQTCCRYYMKILRSLRENTRKTTRYSKSVFMNVAAFQQKINGKKTVYA